MRWINFFSLYFPVYFRHINRSLLLPFLDWKKNQILVIYQWHHSEIAIEAPSKKFLLRVLQLGSGSGVDRVLRGDCCQQLTFPMLSWQIQSGKFTSSTSPKDRGWNSSLAMEFLGDTHHRMTQTPKTFLFPFQHLYVWLVDKILPDLRRGNKVKCAGQLSWLRCHCLFIVICQDWCVSRTKQAPVWKGCLMKETSFSFIVCLCASRGCVYLES